MLILGRVAILQPGVRTTELLGDTRIVTTTPVQLPPVRILTMLLSVLPIRHALIMFQLVLGLMSFVDGLVWWRRDDWRVISW